MIENLDKYWGVAATAAFLLIAIFNFALANINVPEPGEPVPAWRRALLIIVAILGRVFGGTTVKNRGNKEGFEAKWPVFQSAMPKTVPVPKER